MSDKIYNLNVVTIEDKTEQLLQNLRNRGFRITSQRELIIKIFHENQDKHLSAEDIYAIMQQKNEIISLATTYRTLRMLVQLNILRELDFAETHKHYELVSHDAEPHHHIICMNCNQTIEFEDEEINRLGQKIAEKYNIEILDMHFQIFANCKDIEDSSERNHRH
jgi:Fur family ferric uptake transcriptional regulator